jgi:predicted Zn-dependent peptidase
MSKVFKIIFLAGLICFCLPAFAQTNTISFTVNGLKVILKQTEKETLVMNMYYKGGLTNYTAEKAGIESLALSAIIECGNSKYSANEFDDERDEFGLHLSSEATNDYSFVKLRCISLYAEEGWKLFSSAITSPVFDLSKFELLKQKQISELNAGLSNPDERLKRLATSSAFEGSAYANSPDGTIESITALTHDAVKDYYFNTLLNKKRMFLVVAGNISKEELENKIQSAFSGITEKDYTTATVQQVNFKTDAYKIESRPLATNYICGILNAPNLNSADYPAYRIGISLLNNALFREIRLNKRLSYAPSAYISKGKISYATMYASTTKPKETVKAMYETLSYVMNSLYTPETVERLQKNQLISFTKRQEVMTNVADALGEAEVCGDWRLAENFDERVSSVTPKEIKEVLQSYMQHISWAYIGDAALGEQSFAQ